MSGFLLFCVGLFCGGTLAILYLALCKISVFADIPIIFAKWIYDFNRKGYECSLCGKLSDFDYTYCPNCGAKMLRKYDID